MKKRALIFTLALCFVFCLSVLLSGKYLADDDPHVRNVELTVDNKFYENLVYGQPVHDLSGVHLKFKYKEGSEYVDWDSDDSGNSLRVEPWEIFDENHHVFSFYPAESPEFDAELDESGKNKIDVLPNEIVLAITDDENQVIAVDLCSKELPINIQPPTKKGYKFLGYFEEETGGTQIFDREGKKVNNTSENKLFTHWEKTYDITAENTDCEYDGNPKTINPVEAKDPSGNDVTVEYSINGGNYSTNISEVCKDCINIGTYKIDYRYKTSEIEYQNGSVTLNIHGSKKNMFMGVSSISGFDTKLANYNYIWYGHHNYGSGQSDDSPIKFRVLDNQTNDDYDKAGLFLLSEYTLANKKMDSAGKPYYSYYTSNLRNRLYDFEAKNSQGEYINEFRNAFNDLERGQILKTKSLTNANIVSLLDLTPYVNNEDMFLISEYDIFNPKYFLIRKNPYKDTIHTSGAANNYFTSSKILSYPSNLIYTLGSDDVSITGSAGVRPAMNLKVDNVAFTATTKVKDRKEDGGIINGAKAGTVGSMLKKIEEDTENVFDSFKLTLFDKDHLALTANTEEKEIDDINPDKNTIEIDNVQPKKNNSTTFSDNDYVSAIITKDSGEIMYYGRLNTAENINTSHKVTMTIPCNKLPNNQGYDTIENGDYEIKLFLEEYNGGNTDENKTDTCSEFVKIPLTVRSSIQISDTGYNNGLIKEVYNGLTQTIPYPNYQLDPKYVDVQYREQRADGTWSDDDWSFDKPYETNVKYKGVLPDGSPDPESEVIDYKMQVKVSIKEIYKDHPLLKYYTDGIKDVELRIEPVRMDCSAQGINNTTYDGITRRIIVTPYINGENYTIYYKVGENGEYTTGNPEFTNVNDTLNDDGKNGKTVYFKIIACNYEVTEGQTTATISPAKMQMDFVTREATYDGAPHTFDIQNYFPGADKLKILYTYTPDRGEDKGREITSEVKPDFIEAGEHKVEVNFEEIDMDKNGKVNHNYIPRTDSSCTVVIHQGNIYYETRDFEADYDGDPHTIDLFLSYPTISDATVKYSTDNINWTDKKPEFTDAGEYTVYFKITSNNYKDVEDSKKVTIKPAKIICYESQTLDALYDGAQHAASIYVSQPTADKATVLYSNDGGATYTEKEPPRHRDVGVYKQYFMVDAGNNYEKYYGNKTLTISPRSIKKATVETISHRAYTGRPITPSIIINDGTPSIIDESDYVVSYSNNVDKGEATATITGINNYNDQVTETFYITDSDGETPSDTGGSGSSSGGSINESASGGSADLTGMAGSANSLLTGEDIRPLFMLIVTFILSACAALIIYRYKNIKNKGQNR